MSKHKSKKRISKKRVQRRVQKLKELTAEELLLHPELLQSPQFKALPLEKQFQLTSQLKQLRMMMNRPMMGMSAVSGGSGGADSSLYHKLNEVLNKNSRQENENAQLKAQYDAELEKQKQLHEEQNRLKKEQKRREKEMKQQQEMKKVEEAFDEINKEEANNSLKDLKAQYEQAKKDLRADKIHDLLVQIEFCKANLKQLNQTPKIGSPIRPKVKIDMMTQAKDENLQTQFVLQNQINAFTDAGESEKAEHLEDTLLDLESERVGELPTNDDELKKTLMRVSRRIIKK